MSRISLWLDNRGQLTIGGRPAAIRGPRALFDSHWNVCKVDLMLTYGIASKSIPSTDRLSHRPWPWLQALNRQRTSSGELSRIPDAANFSDGPHFLGGRNFTAFIWVRFPTYHRMVYIMESHASPSHAHAGVQTRFGSTLGFTSYWVPLLLPTQAKLGSTLQCLRIGVARYSVYKLALGQES